MDSQLSLTTALFKVKPWLFCMVTAHGKSNIREFEIDSVAQDQSISPQREKLECMLGDPWKL